MTATLLTIQPDFDIKVSTWGTSSTMGLESVIRRADMWGSADINVAVEPLIADGTQPVVVLEFNRYYLKPSKCSWREPTVDHATIRIIDNDVNHAMTRAVEWIAEHPEYTYDKPK